MSIFVVLKCANMDAMQVLLNHQGWMIAWENWRPVARKQLVLAVLAILSSALLASLEAQIARLQRP